MSSRRWAGLKRAAYRMTMDCGAARAGADRRRGDPPTLGRGGGCRGTAACNDRAIAEFLDIIPLPYTEDDARAYIESTRQGWASGTTTNFAIVVDRRSRSARSASAGTRSPTTESRRSATGLRAEARGHGVCTRALKLASRWAAGGATEWSALQLRADEENPASRSVAEKAGFTREGILRSSRYNPRLGRRVDFVMYSLLRGELASRRRRPPTAARPSSGRAGSRGPHGPR